MSKKLIIIIVLVLVPIMIFAQHEGIERHFNSYKLNIVSQNDYTYYNDTLTDEFHIFLPQQKICKSSLGFMNPGTPFVPALYSKMPSHEFWYFKNYYPFIKTHSDFIYFDAIKPFSLFKFRGGGKINEYTGFLHTQNISPGFNFVFDYDVINSDGLYQNNASKVNALGIGTAYTKHKYQSYFHFIFNQITHRENGGIRDEDTFESGQYRSDLLDVNLYNATTKLSQLGIFYNQEYRVGKYLIDTIINNGDTIINKTVENNISFIHELNANRYYRLYTDKPGSFYENIYLDSLNTYDSLTYKNIDNKLLIKFNILGSSKIKLFKIYAGIRNYIYNYQFFNSNNTYISNYILGNLSFSASKLDFNSSVSYCFAGRDVYDTEIYGKVDWLFYKQNSINAYFNFSNLNPYIFDYYYTSNHFRWDISDDIKKVNKLSFGADVNFKNIALDFGTDINLLKNYIIYDYNALPQQIQVANFIAETFIRKKFSFKKIHWDNTFTYQFISNRSLIPLPEFVAYSSLYFKSPIFKDMMILQFGVDLKYHSSVYAYAYMPATGVFYLQDKREIGNYPNFGFHIVAKVKRFRGFVKFSNFNSLFMPDTYYLLYKIPDNPFSLNFGISWEFYD